MLRSSAVFNSLGENHFYDMMWSAAVLKLINRTFLFQGYIAKIADEVRLVG